MSKVFGKYIEKIAGTHEFLTLKFFPGSDKVQQRWRNNGLSANFMADYFATFFSGDCDKEGTNAQSQIKSAVSFIANELLENAMKFNDGATNFATSISLQLDDDRLVFIASNSLTEERMLSFQVYLEKLINSDPYELFIKQIEDNAESGEGSGLGYLTMINDYSAEIGWKFDTTQVDGNYIHCVNTTVQIRFDKTDD